MRRTVSTPEQLHRIAERIHDIADRYSRSVSRPIALTEQLIGEVEGAALDLRIIVRGRG